MQSSIVAVAVAFVDNHLTGGAVAAVALVYAEWRKRALYHDPSLRPSVAVACP